MTITFDLVGDPAGDLFRLGDEIERRVMRSTAFAGAKVLSDEARTLAPVYDGPPRQLKSGKVAKPGALRDAIYHAFSENDSGDGRATYSISWNFEKAPHGHLIENGHWRRNVVVKGKDGSWFSLPQLLPTPVWVPARSFIRRAGDSASARAVDAMRERMRTRLQEVLTSYSVTDDFGNLVSTEQF